MMLHRFIYRSAPLLPPEGAILDILRAADRRNVALRCSGLLYWGPGCYGQIIEGPPEGVAALRASILADCRHGMLWWREDPWPSRAIGTDLPMGSLSASEALADPALAHMPDLIDRSGGLHGLDWAEELSAALIAAAHRKYPVQAFYQAG